MADDDDLHPMFWTEVPENYEKNKHYNAMTEMIYGENSPDEIAETFKNHGNDYYKSGPKGYKDAITYYTKALEESECKNPDILVAVYGNRAQVHLTMKNYRSCIKDCQHAITQKPSVIKNYFRAAKAALAIDQYEECISFCEDGLKIDAEETSLAEMKRDADQKLQKKLAKQRADRQKAQKAGAEDMMLAQAFRRRGIKVGRSAAFDTRMQFQQKPWVDNEQNIHCQAMFLYPEVSQTDFIQDMHEQDYIMSHVETMWNPEEQAPDWDDGSYMKGPLKVYMWVYESGETAAKVQNSQDEVYYKKRWVEIKPEMQLRDCMMREDFVLLGCPLFFVIPATKDQFLKEFLAKEIYA